MSGPGDPEGLYELLGVAPTATLAELRDGYKREALRWHPDRCSDPAAEARMQAINAARDVLFDPVRRAAYDDAAAAFVRLWCDTSLVDAGSVEVLDERVHTVIIRFSGNAHRLGVVDVPRGRSDWWRVEVVAPTVDDTADALLVLRIVVQPRIAGSFRDEVVVEAGTQRVVIEVACTAVMPTKTVWPTGIRRWCRIAAPALVLAAFVLPEMISREVANTPIILPSELAPLLALAVAVLVGIHAKRTRGFSYGTGTDRGLAVALAVPGTAVVMLWVAVVVFAAAVLVIGLAVVAAVVAFAIN